MVTEIAAGVGLANGLVQLAKNARDGLKSTKGRLKSEDSESAEKLAELRDMLSDMVDKTVELRIEHLRLLQANEDLEKRIDLKSNFHLSDIWNGNWAYVPNEGVENFPTNIKLCQVCVDGGRMTVLQGDRVLSCNICQTTIQSRPQDHRPTGVSRGRSGR